MLIVPVTCSVEIKNVAQQEKIQRLRSFMFWPCGCGNFSGQQFECRGMDIRGGTLVSQMYIAEYYQHGADIREIIDRSPGDDHCRIFDYCIAGLTSGPGMDSNCALHTERPRRLMADRRPCPSPSTKGLQVVTLQNGGFEECFITVPAVGNETPAQLMECLETYMSAHPDLRIVRQDIFGQDMDSQTGHAALQLRLGKHEWPVTIIGQGNGAGCPVAGVQVHAVSGVTATPLVLGDRVIGVAYEDDDARYCELGGLFARLARKSRINQAREVFELIEEGLRLAGMTFANVYRTWFYLDNILEWYDDFNEVRNAFFKERKVYDGLVPASTGVGGSNAAGAAVIANAIAIKPKNPKLKVLAVPSPLQCPALKYGSSFSRAVEIDLPTQNRLYVSGTASIGPDGRTAYVGDVNKQVSLTMEVVRAILRSRGMDWCDVTRAIGYFKHAEDAPAFDRYCTSNKLPLMPAIIAKNDICRDDLLFEVEVDAVRFTR